MRESEILILLSPIGLDFFLSILQEDTLNVQDSLPLVLLLISLLIPLPEVISERRNGMVNEL